MKNSEDAALFQELQEAFPRCQFFFRKGVKACNEPGCLDLYSGNFGVAKQMIKHGAPWVLTFEWKRHPREDLRCPALRAKLMSFIRRGAFKAYGMAPICASFSRAITPAIRSRQWPKGIPSASAKMKTKMAEGNGHAEFCRDIIDETSHQDHGYWFENPDKSFIWIQERWEDSKDPASDSIFRLSYCRFGTAWRKDTRVSTSTILAGLRMLCSCCVFRTASSEDIQSFMANHGLLWRSLIPEVLPRCSG